MRLVDKLDGIILKKCNLIKSLNFYEEKKKNLIKNQQLDETYFFEGLHGP
jgi:hypothetical protein